MGKVLSLLLTLFLATVSVGGTVTAVINVNVEADTSQKEENSQNREDSNTKNQSDNNEED
ncbi:hypothetical protein [Persephonella sp.]